MTANLPCGPPMNTGDDYYWLIFSDLFLSDAMLVERYTCMLGEASACLIMLSTKQGSHWYHF